MFRSYQQKSLFVRFLLKVALDAGGGFTGNVNEVKRELGILVNASEGSLS